MKEQVLTKRQLAGFVKDYYAAFSDWEMIGEDRFVRTHGPILQQIGFERLRSGAYRPSMGIRAVAIPEIAVLHQFLDVKHREIRPQEHPTMLKRVIAAMEQQFMPSVRMALDLPEIKRLCERFAVGSTCDLCILTILSAYLQDMATALAYCDQMEQLISLKVDTVPEWEQRHLQFSRLIRQSLHDGTAQQFLERRAGSADC